MNKRSSSRSITSGAVVPRNELPVPVPASISWRAAGLVLAIPVLLCYSTGIEIMILLRVRDTGAEGDPRSVAEDFNSVRAWRKRIATLKVNGASVDILGGEFFESGFNVTAWSPHAIQKAGSLGDEIIFDLDWPEFDSASRVLTGVRRETIDPEILWLDQQP